MKEFRTNRRVQAIASVCVFVALSLINPMADRAEGDFSLWGRVFKRAQDGNGPKDDASTIAFLCVMYAVPAVVVGWIFQAVVALVRRDKTAAEPVAESEPKKPAAKRGKK